MLPWNKCILAMDSANSKVFLRFTPWTSTPVLRGEALAMQIGTLQAIFRGGLSRKRNGWDTGFEIRQLSTFTAFLSTQKLERPAQSTHNGENEVNVELDDLCIPGIFQIIKNIAQ